MRKLVLLVFLILFVGFVAAHGYSDDDYVFKEKISETKYYPRQDKVVTTTTYIDYENEKRYPTYDYRHGYSYRATRDYRDSYKVKSYDKSYSKRYYSDWDYDYNNKDYYYDYVPRLGAYKKKTCYHSAPRGKLFYFKCPN